MFALPIEMEEKIAHLLDSEHRNGNFVEHSSTVNLVVSAFCIATHKYFPEYFPFNK